MEKCHYCGFEYHPMPRWTKPGSLIYICDIKLTEGGHVVISHDCEEKAIKDGYTKRLDLTPKR